MEKILVLGGTGWLGREITRQLLAAGKDMTCLARGHSGDAVPGAKTIYAD
ncbi:NAD-dependent epimerase/dehydratase family protein [Glutamicibacter mishrai]|nr:NAD-dependent epimerase/dehydratase family protein [Glutamicibacter mishrai]UTT40962.1 NAD-dependent epimerase/dehydratase family protein [Glutamicibacter mishrai]